MGGLKPGGRAAFSVAKSAGAPAYAPRHPNSSQEFGPEFAANSGAPYFCKGDQLGSDAPPGVRTFFSDLPVISTM